MNLHRLTNKFARIVTQMDVNDWLIVVTLCLVVGILCMRGYGSRTDY